MSKKNVTVKISEKAIAKAKRKAKEQQRSFNQFVELLFLQLPTTPKVQ